MHQICKREEDDRRVFQEGNNLKHLKFQKGFEPRYHHLEKFSATKGLVGPTAKVYVFCSTSLPLTNTKWVGSTIKPCTAHSL